MKYSDIKKAIKTFKEYGYSRKGYRCTKYWTLGSSCYAISVDMLEVVLTCTSTENFLDGLEKKAKNELEGGSRQ